MDAVEIVGALSVAIWLIFIEMDGEKPKTIHFTLIPPFSVW